MEIGAAFKQLHILFIQALDVFDRLRVGDVETGRIMISIDVDLSILRMCPQDLIDMSRTVKGRDHIDAVLLRFCEDLTHLFLGQIFIRHDRRIRLTLDAESEVLGEMHLQRVHLHVRHLADLTDEPVFADVLARAVDVQAPARRTRATVAYSG